MHHWTPTRNSLLFLLLNETHPSSSLIRIHLHSHSMSTHRLLFSLTILLFCLAPPFHPRLLQRLFCALIFLVFLAALILSQQRISFPHWSCFHCSPIYSSTPTSNSTFLSSSNPMFIIHFLSCYLSPACTIFHHRVIFDEFIDIYDYCLLFLSLFFDKYHAFSDVAYHWLYPV